MWSFDLADAPSVFPLPLSPIPATLLRNLPIVPSWTYCRSVSLPPTKEPNPTKAAEHLHPHIRPPPTSYRIQSDWTDDFSIHLLAPATYIFFASVIPALTFGEQIADHTGGLFGGAQVLLPTAICGVLQAVIGGQPLLIVGVAEPIVLVYVFMYVVNVRAPANTRAC